MGGRCTGFSTCGSHLSVVSLFYGTGFEVYMSFSVIDSFIKNVLASVTYVVIPQMVNPFIYSLKNKEMKEALTCLIAEIPFKCVFGLEIWLLEQVQITIILIRQSA